MPTISDVALEAGVSTATVSRVVNKKGYVTKETKEKVLRAIKILDYYPNSLASYLGRNSSKTGIVGALFASPGRSVFEDYGFYEIIAGIGEVVETNERSLLLEHIRDNYVNTGGLPSMIRKRLVEGLVVGGVPIAEDIVNTISKCNIPLVVIGKYKSIHKNRVLIDNYGGAYQVVEHLLKLGHRTISILLGNTNIYSNFDKLAGFKNAFEDNSLALDDSHILEMHDSPYNSGYLGIERFLELRPRPTALFIADTMITIGSIDKLIEKSIRIPEDLALVSYGSGQMIKSPFGNLTYVSNNTRHIGHEAASMLIKIINNEKLESQDIIIPTSLTIGRTCGSSLV